MALAVSPVPLLRAHFVFGCCRRVVHELASAALAVGVPVVGTGALLAVAPAAPIAIAGAVAAASSPIFSGAVLATAQGVGEPDVFDFGPPWAEIWFA